MAKFPKFTKLKVKFKNYPWRETFLSLKFLPKVFSLLEKILLLILFTGLIALTGYLGYRNWLRTTKLIPEYGGILREGVVGESKDLDKHASRLLYAGLTKYDEKRSIVGDLAQNWEIQEEGKLYVFHLRFNFSSEDLANQIVQKNLWQDIEISTPDPSTITFKFKQPFSPFLYASTKPVFAYGPYRITKEGKNEVELSFREDYHAGRPLIDKIIFKFFSNDDELLKAVKRGDVQGASFSNPKIELNNFQKFEIKLPRDLILFFNLSLKDLQDINVRRALKESASPGKELSLRLVTSDNPKNTELARSIVEKWAKNGVKVSLDIKDNVSLQKTVIPKRDYDLLLYGLDYGEDPDPYPFWHSSQIKEDGKNLSNFKNLKADKLLESARQEFDFQKREEKYAEFQKIIDEEIPMFVVEDQNFYYFVASSIRGVGEIVGSCEADRFNNISSWYIKTKRVRK